MELPLSPVVRAGSLVFLSGVPPVLNGRLAAPGDVRAQTACIFARIREMLAACGLDTSRLVMVHVYLRSPDDFEAMNKEYAEQLSAPYPARKVLFMPLPMEGALIEISAIASCDPVEHPFIS